LKASRRPPLVVAGAVVLVTVGVLNLSATALGDAGTGQPAAWLALTAVLGLTQLLAGVAVASLKSRWWRAAELVAAVGLALNVSAVLLGRWSNLLGLALNAFVLYALNKERRGGR
jgi:hypothetical protein